MTNFEAQFFSMYLFTSLTLYMFRAHRAHHQEIKNCVNTTSGSCQWLCRVQVGTDLHTTQPPTQSDSYQRLYWHNLSLLVRSTMCSKHVES